MARYGTEAKHAFDACRRAGIEMRDFGDYEAFCTDADKLQQITERIGPAIIDVQKALRDPKFTDWARLRPFVQQQLVYIKLATPLRGALERYEATALALAQRLARERDAHKRNLAYLAQTLAAKLRLLDGYLHPDNFFFKSLPELTKKAALAAGETEAAAPASKLPPTIRLAYHNVAPQPEATASANAPCNGKPERASPLSLVTSPPSDDAG